MNDMKESGQSRAVFTGRMVLGKCDAGGSYKSRRALAVITCEIREKSEYTTTGEPVMRDTVDGRKVHAVTSVSLCAEVWNAHRTDILMGGQCVDTVAGYFPGNRKARRAVEIWQRWHLNDMKPGCQHQTAEGWDKRPIDPAKPLNSYGKHFPGQAHYSWNMLTWVRRDEHPEGLLSQPCPVCGYKFGTAWLVEEPPVEVISELRGLFATPALVDGNEKGE